MRNPAIITAIGASAAGIVLSVSIWLSRQPENAADARSSETSSAESPAKPFDATMGGETVPQPEGTASNAVQPPPVADSIESATEVGPGADGALPPMSEEDLLKISARLVEHDPASALEWAQQINTTDMRLQNQLVFAAFTRLVEHDPVRATEWLDRLPAGRARDEAARILVGAVMEKDPKAAFAWARSIGNAEDRSLRMELSLKHWLVVDEPAARAGVRQAMSEAVGRGDVTMVRKLTDLLQDAQRQKRALRY